MSEFFVIRMGKVEATRLNEVIINRCGIRVSVPWNELSIYENCSRAMCSSTSDNPTISRGNLNNQWIRLW